MFFIDPGFRIASRSYQVWPIILCFVHLLRRIAFGSMTFPFDGNDLGMMQESIHHGSGHGVIVVEDLAPLSEGSICCQKNGSPLVLI